MATIVITGASSGIGAEGAAELARRGHRVAVVGRNPERTRSVAESVGGEAFLADFSRLADVAALGEALLARYPRIDVLVNNAGGLVPRRVETVDGHELTLQQNHLAPFLLTTILLPRLRSASGRVVTTASVANRVAQLRLDDLEWRRRPWLGGWRPYATSKLLAILFTRELARRGGIEAFAFHPGWVRSGFAANARVMRLAEHIPGLPHVSVEQGAAPLVHLADTEAIPVPNGTYFDRFTPDGAVHPLANDRELAARVWRITERMLGLPASA